jgi:lipopolysaccharide/colanic/teichoic acid biosynthesis glycosyltransferase
MLAFSFAKAFKSRFRSLWSLFKRILSGLFFGTLFGSALVYVFRTEWGSFPSSIFAVSFPVALFLIFTLNGLLLTLIGRIKKKVVVVGKESDIDAGLLGSRVEIKCVDGVEELLQFNDLDEVVLCKQVYNDRQLNLLIYLLLRLKVSVVFSPLVYAKLLSENIMEKNTIHFLTTFVGRKSDGEEFLIRALDILGSIFLLVLLSPLIALISLLIKLASPGPILYKQVRFAKDGGTFTMYKFKTMTDHAEKVAGPVLAVENDPRVTPIGRFLRQTHLNELPQLFNVICGDMSLVGPRPELPNVVKHHRVLRQIRLAVKPGLTGLAQIRAAYNIRPKHVVKYDCLYIQRRSVLLNLYILMKTAPVVFSRKGW